MKTFAIAALASVAIAAPFEFPLPNGFPNPSPQAVLEIQKEAGGPLPNGALPKDLSPGVITSLQLIAANEIFEVAYFTELLSNITNKVPGYDCIDDDEEFVKGAIKRIRAQEELHAIGANAILKNAGQQTVGPCKYQFPVDNYDSAVKLANTFTDVVLGVLPAVQFVAGTNGGAEGPALIPLIGSIEEQEAQQVGWFRTLQDKFPSAAPFLVPTTPEFALSAVSMFLVPGSCPPEYAAVQAAVKSFPPLKVTKEPTKEDQNASYEVEGPVALDAAIAYISGQNLPVSQAIFNVQTKDGKTTFDAPFPAIAAPFADGLTVAALVPQNKNYASAADVAANTIYGPGLIEYN